MGLPGICSPPLVGGTPHLTRGAIFRRVQQGIHPAWRVPRCGSLLGSIVCPTPPADPYRWGPPSMYVVWGWGGPHPHVYVAWGRVDPPCQRALYTPIQRGVYPMPSPSRAWGGGDTFLHSKKHLGWREYPHYTHDPTSRLKIAKSLNILCIMVKNHRKTVCIMYNG